MRTDDPARPQRRFPRALFALAAVLTAARLFGPSVRDRVSWVRAAEAVPSAAATGRPLLYNFTAEWCAPCKRLERDVFADPQMANWIGRKFMPVRVVDREREDGHNPPEVEQLQAQYKVDTFPTLVVVGADGSVISQVTGYSGSQHQMRRFLNAALENVATAEMRRSPKGLRQGHRSAP